MGCSTRNVSEIDLLNFASASLPFKEIVDKTIEVKKISVLEDYNNPEVLITNIVDSDGKCYGGNSAVIAESAMRAAELMNAKEALNEELILHATVRTSKSKGGKDFLYLEWS